MIYVYIKAEVKKKNDTTAINAALNEVCTG